MIVKYGALKKITNYYATVARPFVVIFAQKPLFAEIWKLSVCAQIAAKHVVGLAMMKNVIVRPKHSPATSYTPSNPPP